MKIKRDFSEGNVKFISGKEFKDSGLLWFTNTMLHLFGMALTFDPDTGELKAAIVPYRGFNEITNTNHYRKVSEYLMDNIEEIIKDVH